MLAKLIKQNGYQQQADQNCSFTSNQKLQYFMFSKVSAIDIPEKVQSKISSHGSWS
jgi:hypothetical protein